MVNNFQIGFFSLLFLIAFKFSPVFFFIMCTFQSVKFFRTKFLLCKSVKKKKRRRIFQHFVFIFRLVLHEVLTILFCFSNYLFQFLGSETTVPSKSLYVFGIDVLHGIILIHRKQANDLLGMFKNCILIIA